MSRHNSEPVELIGNANDNGLAMMLATLIGQNLTDHPELLDGFAQVRGRVALVAEDAEVSLTLHFRGGKLDVFDGILGTPDLTIRTGSDEIISLSLLESTLFGLPDPRGEHMQKVAKAVYDGRLRIHGLPTHLPLLLRMSKILAVS